MKVYELMNILSKCEAGAEIEICELRDGLAYNYSIDEILDDFSEKGTINYIYIKQQSVEEI